MPAKRTRYEAWDATRVRALRKHLGYTQQQLSDELGTRQQTISEWETGMYQPRGASANGRYEAGLVQENGPLALPTMNMGGIVLGDFLNLSAAAFGGWLAERKGS